ncbi:hypothetical protein [Lentzea sp. E54]|uniref:hypothetical protein n=1 Tax=Lentzea xerophila TaxID=3435883 RepID=UPI003DA3ED63
MWNRSDVDFVHSTDLPWQPVPEGDLGALAGGRKRLLSSDPGDGAETFLLQLNARHRGVLTAEADLYVVAGSGVLDGEPLEVNDYVYVPAGATVDLAPSVRGLTLYCGLWGPPEFNPEQDSGVRAKITHTEHLKWTAPTWNGDTPLDPGAMTKVLRADDSVYIYLAAMLPGWRSADEEAHPVYEESFKLYGDVLMGARGVMREGAYFFRSPDVFHGPLYSRGGTMSFIRSDAAPTTVYRTPPSGGAWDELAGVAYAD